MRLWSKFDGRTLKLFEKIDKNLNFGAMFYIHLKITFDMVANQFSSSRSKMF